MSGSLRLFHFVIFGIWLVLLSCGGASWAQQARSTAVIDPPPMGWSSWNSFSNTVDSHVVMEEARALISTGLHAAGYKYVNIDEGWWLGQRDAEGNIVVDPEAWPALAPGEHAGDMSNIVRFIHGLGLKAGIYTDAGANGCSMYPDLGPKYFHTGSEGHYDQDFLQFAKWGFDYVKVDWCGGDKENLDPAVQYAEIAQAIQRAEAITGHRMFFSICEWGKNSPWTWAPNVGGISADIWRTSGDIVAPVVANAKHAGRKAQFSKAIGNFEQGQHPEAQHTGYENDLDMMVIGMPGLDERQDRAHMAMWSVSGAPLILGADLTKLNQETLAILMNRAVLAIDQDPLGLPAVKVAQPGKGLEAWSKRLAEPGARAMLLLNRTESAEPITVKWDDLGLASSSGVGVEVTDVWTGKKLPASSNSYSATVQPQDAALVLVHGRNRAMTAYSSGDAEQGVPVTNAVPVRFNHVTSQYRMAAIRIRYRNAADAPAYAELHVNHQVVTRIGFPPTGGGVRAVWVQAMLSTTKPNTVSFSATTWSARAPKIVSLAVQ